MRMMPSTSSSGVRLPATKIASATMAAMNGQQDAGTRRDC